MNIQTLKPCKALLYFDGSLPLSADNASPYGINDIHGFLKNVVLGWGNTDSWRGILDDVCSGTGPLFVAWFG